LLNKTNTDQIVDVNHLKHNSLSNYDVLKGDLKDREKTVLTQLLRNFPPEFNKKLTTLCTQYSDVFGLDTDMSTTNNFYKHKLRQRDEEPMKV